MQDRAPLLTPAQVSWQTIMIISLWNCSDDNDEGVIPCAAGSIL